MAFRSLFALGVLAFGTVVPVANAGVQQGDWSWRIWGTGEPPTTSSGYLASPGSLPAIPVTTPPSSWSSSPAPVPSPGSTASASTPQADAFINLGAGPYPQASQLTTGGAQPWYDSPQVDSLFGGQPTPQQQAAFASAVLQRVEQTFQLAGVPVTLTTDPSVPAAHTLSVVSQTANGSVTNAIGMTNLGGNGFNFIDQAAQYASSVDQLEWLVAHNVSHELMIAFGVGENYDTTGNYIDARNATLTMMLNPNATFSPAAAQALNAADFSASTATGASPYAQVIGVEPVPEPATLALWAMGLIGAAGSTRLAAARGRARPRGEGMAG